MSTREDRVRGLCEAMDSESIFHMSLHSKELFHSNMLAWFCEKYPSAAQEVFGRWVEERESTIHRIQREHKYIDLIIELPGLAPLVVENKVFAPINEAQLVEYADTKKLKDLEGPTFLCLSLGAPTWNKSGFVTPSGRTWRYLSYSSLVGALAEVVDQIDGFDGELLRSYVRFVRLLQNLADEVGSLDPDESIKIDGSTRSHLQKIRMHDAFDKLRYRTAMLMLETSLRSKFDFHEVAFKTDFTNGEPLMEAFVSFANGDRVGWQLQGLQWRLAVISASFVGDSEKLIIDRHEYVKREYGDWFDFSELPLMVAHLSDKPPRAEEKGGFNRFNPDFVYRYRKVPNMTIEELQRLSVHFIKRALKLRDSRG